MPNDVQGDVAQDRPAPAIDGLAERLAEGVTGTAERVLVGLNWTMVAGPLGIGLSHSPARGTSGCYGLPAPGSYAGQNLAELARLTASANVFERAIAFAAINAHHNRFDLEGDDVNGLDLIEDRDERTVVIGQFPGLEKRVPGAAVIEREPRPGCYPPEAAETLLPQAEQVLITASTLSNGTLGPMLPLIPHDAFVVLVGPSAPLAPVLFDCGIDAVSGFVARHAEALTQAVMEGGAVSAMRPHGRFVTLMNR